MSVPVVDPGVPYIGPVATGRFSPQQLVRIQGSIPSIAYRFNINLQCGPNITPQDDIAIQISVRLLDGYIVLNSLCNGVWDEELRKDNIFIKRAERFEIVILCKLDQFKVFINDQHYCDFPQRIHFDKITHLSIDGDVSIIQISYESSSPTAGVPGLLTSAAPRLAAPIATEFDDDFEIVDTNPRTVLPQEYAHQRPGTGFQPPAFGFQPHQGFPPPPNSFSADPPAYEEAIHSQHPKLGAPYPTNSPYPSKTAPYSGGTAPYPQSTAPYPNTTAPYPNTNAPYPSNTTPYPTSNAAPYPLNDPLHPTGPSYPSTAPYPTNNSFGAQNMPLPLNSSTNVIIPLNAPGSTAIPIKRDNTLKHCCTILWTIVFIIIIVVAIVVTRKKKTTYDWDNSAIKSDSLDNYKWEPNWNDDFWNNNKNKFNFD